MDPEVAAGEEMAPTSAEWGKGENERLGEEEEEDEKPGEVKREEEERRKVAWVVVGPSVAGRVAWKVAGEEPVEEEELLEPVEEELLEPVEEELSEPESAMQRQRCPGKGEGQTKWVAGAADDGAQGWRVGGRQT